MSRLYLVGGGTQVVTCVPLRTLADHCVTICGPLRGYLVSYLRTTLGSADFTVPAHTPPNGGGVCACVRGCAQRARARAAQ